MPPLKRLGRRGEPTIGFGQRSINDVRPRRATYDLRPTAYDRRRTTHDVLFL